MFTMTWELRILNYDKKCIEIEKADAENYRLQNTEAHCGAGFSVVI